MSIVAKVSMPRQSPRICQILVSSTLRTIAKMCPTIVIRVRVLLIRIGRAKY